MFKNLDSIRKVFETKLDTVILDSPLEYENIADSLALIQAKQKKEQFCRLTISDSVFTDCFLGDRLCKEVRGVVFLSFFFPFGIGTAKLRKLLTKVMNFIFSDPDLRKLVTAVNSTKVSESKDYLHYELTCDYLARVNLEN